MTELTKKMVEERARELMKVYWHEGEYHAAEDMEIRLATYTLASELQARIDELNRKLAWARTLKDLPNDFERGYKQSQETFTFITKMRIVQLTEQLKDLGEVL